MKSNNKKTADLFLEKCALCLLSLLCVVLSIFLIAYQPGFGYEISANGTPIGFVKHLKDIKELSKKVDADLKEEYGDDITYDLEITHKKGRLAGVILTTEEEFKNKIIDSIDVYAASYLIKSDNSFIMALNSKESAEAVLEKIKAPYANLKKDSVVDFVQDVKIIQSKAVPCNMILDEKEAIHSLAEPILLASTSRSALVRGNMKNGSKNKLKPLIDVRTVYNETGTVVIKTPLEKRKNSDLTEGKTKVIAEGSPGKKEVKQKVTMINGEITSTDITYEKILVAAKPRIIEYGTKPKVSGVVSTAFNYLGTPYVWGGTSPSGFDCSGFTQYVFRKRGIYLPRTSYEQASVGEKVSRGNLKAGDLVCFPGHVGIYIGGDQFIHAPHPGSHVKIDTLSSRRNFKFGRRVSY